MINLDKGVRCNKQAIERYLTAWGVDWQPLFIIIQKGDWSLNSFGRWERIENNPNAFIIKAFDSNWYHIPGGTKAKTRDYLMALIFRRFSKDNTLADLAISKVVYHEFCHIIGGIDECRNSDKTKRYSCIMYENLWYQEIAAMPLQAMRNFTLCDDCKKRLKGNVV